MRIRIVGAAVFAATLGTSALAQEGGFDPRQTCGEVLMDASDADRMMAAAWTFGFLAANTNDIRPVDRQNNTTLLGNLDRACAASPNTTLLALVGGSAKHTADVPGSEAEARALLMKFYEPGTDRNALTQALLPTPEDIRFVYAEPLASALVKTYGESFGPGTTFGPKPDHNEVLMAYGTTRQLAERQAVLREFPGGYKDVLQYFRADVPIVRFKFVTKGETLGLAFDGLVFVNERWVIMPKPWRSLPQ
ncbi:hypothetical protein C1J03_12800 [Sulfitobacter sp. SK012]|uniref:hypothetical protein n=1 Tax=Sulfitobacter sp. SK012 TaxID=1389005 RepID=UPI000E0B816B|nr:hypothetical protein [Sulfitobacter sp. SK012]AXI46825.1 hypothetical protein C1J03_12800 [Sulfitobacter sp. SK012]